MTNRFIDRSDEPQKTPQTRIKVLATKLAILLQLVA
jgi:hypothetical protein